MLKIVRYKKWVTMPKRKAWIEEQIDDKRYNELVQMQIRGEIERLRTFYIKEREEDKWKYVPKPQKRL